MRIIIDSCLDVNLNTRKSCMSIARYLYNLQLDKKAQNFRANPRLSKTLKKLKS